MVNISKQDPAVLLGGFAVANAIGVVFAPEVTVIAWVLLFIFNRWL